MKLYNFIPILSSLGALAASIIALFTLLELFRQRKASYKPDLCVLKKHFKIINWKNILSKKWYKPDSQENDNASIRIVNIGFGAARNLVANWSFNVDEFIYKVNLEPIKHELQINRKIRGSKRCKMVVL